MKLDIEDNVKETSRGHPDQRPSAEKPKSVAPTVTSMWRHRRNLDVGQEGYKIDGNLIRRRAVVRALCWLAADAMPDGPRKRATFETNMFFIIKINLLCLARDSITVSLFNFYKNLVYSKY